jgi:hypothetical protein
LDISGNNIIVSVIDINDETQPGHVLIYSRDQGGTDNWGKVCDKYILNDSHFGDTVAISGNTAIVSDGGIDRSGYSSKFGTFVYTRQVRSNTWACTQVIAPTSHDSSFGNAISTNGKYAVIGHTHNNSATSTAGASLYIQQS